ncbi:MAG: hypothetical protein ACYTFM_07150 [Planctomycetota bacterium]|jgi:hypothetical protein
MEKEEPDQAKKENISTEKEPQKKTFQFSKPSSWLIVSVVIVCFGYFFVQVYLLYKSTQVEESFYVRLPALVDKEETPIIGIYTTPHDHVLTPLTDEDFEPQVIIAVWSDGQVVCSKDQLYGGRPYFMGNIPQETITGFIKEVSTHGAFNASYRYCSNNGLDSSNIVIAINHDENKLNMESWHEYVGDTKSAWFHGSITYMRFVKAWDVIRQASSELIPTELEPIDNIHFEIRSYEDETMK